MNLKCPQCSHFFSFENAMEKKIKECLIPSKKNDETCISVIQCPSCFSWFNKREVLKDALDNNTNAYE